MKPMPTSPPKHLAPVSFESGCHSSIFHHFFLLSTIIVVNHSIFFFIFLVFIFSFFFFWCCFCVFNMYSGTRERSSGRALYHSIFIILLILQQQILEPSDVQVLETIEELVRAEQMSTIGSTVSCVTVAPPGGVRFISLLATSMVAAVVEASFGVYRKEKKDVERGPQQRSQWGRLRTTVRAIPALVAAAPPFRVGFIRHLARPVIIAVIDASLSV